MRDHSKYISVMNILFDVAEQSHTTQCPVFGAFVRLEVNRSDIIGDGPVRFPVYRTLVLPAVSARSAVDGVDEDHRHRFKQHFWF